MNFKIIAAAMTLMIFAAGCCSQQNDNTGMNPTQTPTATDSVNDGNNGNIVDDAGDAVKDMTDGAGKAVEDVGNGVGNAVKNVAQ